MKTTILAVIAPETNAGKIGDVYAAFDGVSWNNSLDNCDNDGNGRVFLVCDSTEVVEFVCEQLDADDRIVRYDVQDFSQVGA